ncbi:MAG: hypothetical protein JEY79_18545 [Pseudodesulfovibrio sp.]|nr:hypothetical protein [Pseudodesulfovibrio sp.]
MKTSNSCEYDQQILSASEGVREIFVRFDLNKKEAADAAAYALNSMETDCHLIARIFLGALTRPLDGDET